MGSNPTQLLISIRDASEAAIVLANEVDWIDLKEPAFGSLGQPSIETATAVATVLADHAHRSVAIGELRKLDFRVAYELAQHFPVLKVGLSYCRSDGFNWCNHVQPLQVELRKQNAELILVAYADAATCSAPPLPEVLNAARQFQSPFLLIDTFTKDGRDLLSWLSANELAETIAAANQFGCQVVLAGSIRADQVPTLLALKPAAIAIRGAVCSSRTAAGRSGAIEPAKVAAWCAQMRDARMIAATT